MRADFRPTTVHEHRCQLFATFQLRRAQQDGILQEGARLPPSRPLISWFRSRLTERLGLWLRDEYDSGGSEAPKTSTTQYDNIRVFFRRELSTISETINHCRPGQATPRRADAQFRKLQQCHRAFPRPHTSCCFFQRFEAGGRRSMLRRVAGSRRADRLKCWIHGLDIDVPVPVTGRWGVGVAAEAFRNRRPDGRVGLQDRAYASIAPGVDYRIDESLRLTRFVPVSLAGPRRASGRRDLNAIFLTLNSTRPWDL